MTQHLPTWAQAARCLAIALGATALLSATLTLARAAPVGPQAWLRSPMPTDR
jgi:hypothetical protein